MLGVDEVGKIQRAHFRDGRSIKGMLSENEVGSSRISASTASTRASGSGGNRARILQVPVDHAHDVDEADPVRVLPGVSDRPVD